MFAPEDFGGIGLSTINTEQGVDHIQALICHLRADATVGSLLTILLRTSQLISGFSTDIFLNPHLDLQFMAEFKQKWVCKVRNIIGSVGVKLHLTDHWTLLAN